MRLFVLIFLLSIPVIAEARQASSIDEVTIDLQFNDEFEAENLVDLITLTFNSSTQSPVIFFEIENRGNEQTEELFAEIIVRSKNMGDLLTSRQSLNNGFVIPPGESIEFSNLDMIRGVIPGVSEGVRFDFSLSSKARDILSALRDGAVIGDDLFEVEVKLFSESNAQNYLASNLAEFETVLSQDQISIRPDDDANERLSNIDLRAEKPSFEWQGRQNQTYRLVVVAGGENVDSGTLLNNRFNKEFSPNSTRDLSENVYLDIIVRGNSFELPDGLINSLEQGKDYAWQVQSDVRTTRDTVQVRSDIWTFSTNRVLDDELIDLLTTFFGRDRVQQMLNEGLQLHRIELEGQVYNAEEAIEVLREMRQKINNNRAKIGDS